MNDDFHEPTAAEGANRTAGYRPPVITYLGNLAELTQKTVGAADGATFLGLDIGSV